MLRYNPNDAKQAALFHQFYTVYIFELSQYSERLRENPVTLKELHDIDNNQLLKHYFITDEDNNPIGFILLGFNENTQPGTDWFIAEFHVTKEHREKGYGTKAVEELLQTHPGKYCYFVLKENLPAQRFWRKMQTKFHCTNITNQYDASEYTPYDCTFHAFTTTRKES